MCHHVLPRRVTFEQRDLLALFGKAASLKLSSLKRDEDSLYMGRVRQAIVNLIHAVRESGDIEAALHLVEADYLGLADACGIVIAFDEHVYVIGETPGRKALDLLTLWLKGNMPADGVFHTDCLGERYPPARQCQISASGLLAIALDANFRGYILWFRPEVVQEVPWMGWPTLPALQEPGGRRWCAGWKPSGGGHGPGVISRSMP